MAIKSETLALLAVSGMVLGLAGCEKGPGATGIAAATSDTAIAAGSADPKPGDKDKACCKGLNECKGKGGCGTDTHSCSGKNECKGKGGCKHRDCS